MMQKEDEETGPTNEDASSEESHDRGLEAPATTSDDDPAPAHDPDSDPGPGQERPIYRSGYIALVGAPNAGKSTLMNQLVQSRLAIVSPKPQTTRRRTLGIVSGEGYQMILLDTPGIIEPRYALQKAMMRTVGNVLSDADAACLLLDVTHAKPGEIEIPDSLRTFRGKRILALNKVDILSPKERMIPILQELAETGLFEDLVPISALKGDGVPALLQELVRCLPEGVPFYPADQLTEQPERFFVGELIREAVFGKFSEEVPYSVEVIIEDFKERPGAKDFIQASLVVEQDSQKGILIGHKGAAIRALGESARTAIEEFLERPVYLELRVKVLPKWRKNEVSLRRLGFRP
jgi:GTP-binding protein Era